MGGILNRTWEMLHDGRFLKKALMIACPVALQGMLNKMCIRDSRYPVDLYLQSQSNTGPFKCYFNKIRSSGLRFPAKC